MAMDTYMLVAAQYVDENDALADYDEVEQLYRDLDVIDTYDAAVITKDGTGKVRIVKKVEEPTRHGAEIGLAVGLAVGAPSRCSRPSRSGPVWSSAAPRARRSARPLGTSRAA
jgi:uncharacterized membrane protein